MIKDMNCMSHPQELNKIAQYDYSNSVWCVAGAGDIAVDVLEYLLERKRVPTDRLIVLCRKTENGIDGWQKSLRAYAARNKISEETLESIYPIKDMVFLSVEFDRIIRPELFSTKLLFNIHFSALPEYKGMYTSILPILHNKKETGVTFHVIDAGIDTGDIIFQKKFKIEFDDTAADVYRKLVQHGTRLVKMAVDEMIDHSRVLTGMPQPAENSSYYGKGTLDYSSLRVDTNQTAECIRNQIRAYFFPVYQTPVVAGYKISSAIICGNRSTFPAGTIIDDAEDRIVMATIDYDIVLKKWT